MENHVTKVAVTDASADAVAMVVLNRQKIVVVEFVVDLNDLKDPKFFKKLI